MLALGALYYDGEALGQRDDKQALYYLKKAAEEGQPQAMLLLGKIYTEGEITQKNAIKARYWRNQAEQLGVGTGNQRVTEENYLATAFRHGDFSNTYTVYEYDDGDTQVIDNGPDIMGGLVGGMMSGWMASRSNQQEIIDGVELMKSAAGNKTYGGTITTTFATPVVLKKGQTVRFTSSGRVVLGMFAGACSPNGLTTNQFDSYSVARNVSHGAVMGRINQGTWFKIGTSLLLVAEEDGTLSIGINDSDYSNNRGYFDLKIDVVD